VHARVIVNGRLKGLYQVEERLGREFVRKRFGNPVNELYEFTEVTKDIQWLGPNYDYVPHMWLPKIEDVDDGVDAVRTLMDLLNNNPAAAEAVFDIDSFLAFIAAEMVSGEGDAYVAGSEANRSDNIYMYVSPLTGKFMFLPWDRDQGFWREDDDILFGFSRRILTRNLILSDPSRVARYKQLVRQLIEGAWAAPVMQARVDYVSQQINDAVIEDPLRPSSVDDFRFWVKRVKRYVEERNAAFLQQMGP
jgi:hypothetical protein